MGNQVPADPGGLGEVCGNPGQNARVGTAPRRMLDTQGAVSNCWPHGPRFRHDPGAPEPKRLPRHHLAGARCCTELQGSQCPWPALPAETTCYLRDAHNGEFSAAPGLGGGWAFRSLCGVGGRPHVAATIFPSPVSFPLCPLLPLLPEPGFQNQGQRTEFSFKPGEGGSPAFEI